MHRATTLIFFVFAGISLVFAQSDLSEEEILVREFAAWQQEQLAEHTFWAKDSCNMEWYAAHEEAPAGFGFPSSGAGEYVYAYGDLNSDGKRDQLVMFRPVQCDGGNASAWLQIGVFTLSQKKGYTTISDLTGNLFPQLKTDAILGSYQYSGIADNQVEMILYRFSDSDPHCCPSTQIPVTFDYTTGEVLATGENQATISEPESTAFFLGKFVSDPESLDDIPLHLPSGMTPIRESGHKMEIRLFTVPSFRSGHTIVLSYDTDWSAELYTSAGKKHIVTTRAEQSYLDALFPKLVENKVFSLPNDETLETTTAFYDPVKDELTGQGKGSMLDGVFYILEFKVGNEFRQYHYANPDNYANACPQVDEFRYFMNIVELFNSLTDE
jgi:hypothetical protein